MKNILLDKSFIQGTSKEELIQLSEQHNFISPVWVFIECVKHLESTEEFEKQQKKVLNKILDTSISISVISYKELVKQEIIGKETISDLFFDSLIKDQNVKTKYIEDSINQISSDIEADPNTLKEPFDNIRAGESNPSYKLLSIEDLKHKIQNIFDKKISDNHIGNFLKEYISECKGANNFTNQKVIGILRKRGRDNFANTFPYAFHCYVVECIRSMIYQNFKKENLDKHLNFFLDHLYCHYLFFCDELWTSDGCFKREIEGLYNNKTDILPLEEYIGTLCSKIIIK